VTAALARIYEAKTGADLASALKDFYTPVCPDCASPRNKGLCSRETCRKAVLPQIAKPALVRLIGEVNTEQTKRQKQAPMTPKERAQIAKIGRRNARRVAKSQRRGIFGLALAISRAK
jgi:hypothetical protein